MSVRNDLGLTSELIQEWRRELLGLNLTMFEPTSARTAFFQQSPLFINSLYPETTLLYFIPQNYRAYMGDRPSGLLNRSRWQRNLKMFAWCTEWISLALPYPDNGMSIEDEEIGDRLREAMPGTGLKNRDADHAAARIRLNLVTLFNLCEESLTAHQPYLDYVDRGYIRETSINLYKQWLPLYKQLLTGDLLHMPRKELDSMRDAVVELQARVTKRKP